MTEEMAAMVVRCANNQGRDQSFTKALVMCEELPIGGAIVETGCMRGISDDGQSTRILSEFAKQSKRFFVSVDLSLDSVTFARKELPGVDIVEMDSVMFLSRFSQKISLLYLDSYDFLKEDPGPCQRHQLAEIGAAIGNILPEGLILIDDCDLPSRGKCGLSEIFLKERGWKKIHDGYQTLWENYERADKHTAR